MGTSLTPQWHAAANEVAARCYTVSGGALNSAYPQPCSMLPDGANWWSIVMNICAQAGLTASM